MELSIERQYYQHKAAKGLISQQMWCIESELNAREKKLEYLSTQE